MSRKLRLVIVVGLVCVASARDKVENWVQVTSPHFVVATNDSERQARKIADQFERMRSVFHVLFPKLQIDPSSPIIVLAAKDEKTFRTLEPQGYLAKGQLKLGGLFLSGPDKNYVLLNLDAHEEHSYATVYHEYTHMLLSKADYIPLWLNEGLAEFYENTDIDGKDVRLGQPNFSEVELLKQTRLLPLPQLFAVDYKSPYYHQEDKGSVFYSESWALSHYLYVQDFKHQTSHLHDYLELLASKTDAITAAAKAFGDLKTLERSLDIYVQQGQFGFFKTTVSSDVDESAFKAESLGATQSDALRADFLAYNRRAQDARTLLDHILRDDPKNVQAHETLGFLEFSESHFPEAKNWYQQAVELDSQNYLAHYYFAVISMQGPLDSDSEKQVENSLRQCIKLNPSFAPAFDRLAVFLGSRRRDLTEAHMMGLSAVTLDPANVGYRVNVANVLMEMDQPQNAEAVLRNAMKLAKTEEDTDLLTQALINVQNYSTAQAEAAARESRLDDDVGSAEKASAVQDSSDNAQRPHLVRRDFVASGPHRFVTGVLNDVHCNSSSMDLAVKSGSKTLSFHADNYYTIQFSVLGFQPKGDLKPCDELEGRPAKVEYIESADKSQPPHLLSVELHK